MNLSAFVSQCRPRWQELERLVRLMERGGPSGQDPAMLRRFAQLYRQVTDDLALARTFFTDSQVCQYLNMLVAQAHPLLYGRPRQRPLAAAKRFFAADLPVAFRQCGRAVIAAACIFLLPTLIAYLATLDHDGLAKAMLPEGVLQSVDDGKMWTESVFIYTPGEVLTTQITLNNIGVTFLTFAGGVLAGLGTLFELVLNGLHLGCAAGYAQRGGLTGEFWSFVVAHGFLEIFVITMAGGAGIHMGMALISPGQMTRGQAFRDRGRRAVKLIIGGVPMLMVAGTIEGMVSGGPPVWIAGTLDVGKMLLGMLLLTLVLSYLLMFGRRGEASADLSVAERAGLPGGLSDQSGPRCLVPR